MYGLLCQVYELDLQYAIQRNGGRSNGNEILCQFKASFICCEVHMNK